MDQRSAPRGVVDTSVLIAGIAGFKSYPRLENPSSRMLRDWLDRRTFVWLVSEEIFDEYKEIMSRLRVRRSAIGSIINLLREEAELIDVPIMTEVSPDRADEAFCACAETGDAAFIVTLNPKDFPQRKLRAKVISPSQKITTTAPRRR